jgi:hypothetical protein
MSVTPFLRYKQHAQEHATSKSSVDVRVSRAEQRKEFGCGFHTLVESKFPRIATMPVNHDEVIKALCTKAAKVDNASKLIESKIKAKKSSPRSVASSVPSAETDLQRLFDVLCAKAKDVAIASKISEASEQFGTLSPAATTKAPVNVLASLCARASTFQLYDDDDDETTTHHDETTVGSSFPKKRNNDFDQLSTTTDSSSESETSNLRLAAMSNSPSHILAGLCATSSGCLLYNGDETASYRDEPNRDEPTMKPLSKPHGNDFDHQNRAPCSNSRFETSESDSSRRRASISSSPTKVAPIPYAGPSTFKLFDDDETATNYDESTVGSFSKRYFNDFDKQNHRNLSSLRRASLSSHPANVGASLYTKPSTFQLFDDDETATNYDETTVDSLSKLSCNDFDQQSRRYPSSLRRASLSSFPTNVGATLYTKPSNFQLFDDDETATNYDESTVGSLFKQFCNDVDQQTNRSPTSLRASVSSSSPTKIVANLYAKPSTLHLYDDDETATHHDETTVGSLSQQFCNDFDQQSSTIGSITGKAASMTSEELYELSKGLVTTPSGGKDTLLGIGQPGPPPRVMLNPKSNCDTSITSELTDWDFGFSKSGPSSLSELDADKVVENFYKMAATDPVLARRIALAASSVLQAEDSHQHAERDSQQHAARVGKVYPRGFSTLATVRECDDNVEPAVVKPTAPKPPVVKQTSSKPMIPKSGSRRMRSLPRANPPMPGLASITSLEERKPQKKSRTKPISGSHFKQGEFQLGSPQSKRDPPGRTKLDNNPGFCFIQDNPKTHR